jgi:hypothetical protein
MGHECAKDGVKLSTEEWLDFLNNLQKCPNDGRRWDFRNLGTEFIDLS